MKKEAQLIKATKDGDVGRVRELLASGVDPNIREKYVGYTPLIEAADQGRLDLVQCLLEGGADPNLFDSGQMVTPLMFGARGGQREVVETRGMLTTFKTVSAATDSRAIVRTLLDSGAEINARSRFGWTAVMWAARSRREEIVEMLLTRSASRAGMETIPIFKAFSEEVAWETVRHIIETLPNVNFYSEYGHPLWACINRGFGFDGVRFLTERGLDLNTPDNYGNTLLKYSIQGENLEQTKFLVERGANIQGLDSEGKGALYWASGDKPMIAFVKATLARMGVQSNRRTDEIETPDFRAASQSEEFKQVASEITARCRRAAEPIFESSDMGGAAWTVKAGGAAQVVDELQGEFLKRQCYVFATDDDRIACLPTSDKYQVIAFMEPDGSNYDIDTADIIRALKRLDRKQPFVVTGVSSDFVSGRFLSRITDATVTARQLTKLCPELVDDAEHKTSDVAKEITRTGRFFLWWD